MSSTSFFVENLLKPDTGRSFIVPPRADRLQTSLSGQRQRPSHRFIYPAPVGPSLGFADHSPKLVSAPSARRTGPSSSPSPYEGNFHACIQKKAQRTRFRTSFNHTQVSTLEIAFQNSHYPDIVTREQLSHLTGLPEPRIQVWFKNRRAKHRKCQRMSGGTDGESCGSPDNEFGLPCIDAERVSTCGSADITQSACVMTVNSSVDASTNISKSDSGEELSGDKSPPSRAKVIPPHQPPAANRRPPSFFVSELHSYLQW